MSDEKKEKNVIGELKNLGSIVDELEGFKDPLEEALGGFEDIGIGSFNIAGAPKEIGLFDTVLVHGFRADYKLTFEETEEGLVISVADVK